MEAAWEKVNGRRFALVDYIDALLQQGVNESTSGLVDCSDKSNSHSASTFPSTRIDVFYFCLRKIYFRLHEIIFRLHE